MTKAQWTVFYFFQIGLYFSHIHESEQTVHNCGVACDSPETGMDQIRVLPVERVRSVV